MSDDVWLSDRGCPTCHEAMLRQDCWKCGGEGGFDGEELMEEDPLWHRPDDYEDCDECRGRGFFEWCGECAKKKSAQLEETDAER